MPSDRSATPSSKQEAVHRDHIAEPSGRVREPEATLPAYPFFKLITDGFLATVLVRHPLWHSPHFESPKHVDVISVRWRLAIFKASPCPIIPRPSRPYRSLSIR